jgi:hypothetical protein
MGHQFSKAEGGDADVPSSKNLSHPPHHPKHRNLSIQKPAMDNDGLSRATEITDDMTPPPSPSVGKLRHSESWRRGAGVSTTSATTSSSIRASYPMIDSSHSVNATHSSSAAREQYQRRGLLPRRDSDPGHPSEVQPSQPRTVPVKCPPRKRHTSSSEIGGDGKAPAGPASLEDGLEASYLERLYDSRTWEMYRRITESRKQSKTKYVPTAGAAGTAATAGQRGVVLTNGGLRTPDDTSEWENLQQEEETSGEESQHEMIFFFDF